MGLFGHTIPCIFLEISNTVRPAAGNCWNFFSSKHDDNHDQVYGADKKHHSSWTHEIIAGAAGFEAMKVYEKHVAANGKPASHALAKELLAGFAAAEADKLAETKGLDLVAKEKAKHDAKKKAESLYDQQYLSYDL
ncbi:hypothetical protein BDK51DRAFT_33039 [Blyttiomyces helicus]|uniref:CipC-like antibiotic response protein n=1 Tax=Blyttiomyces helicus TaxID=388810 RepID=A0A4P9W6D2_9FUNG|nr:hypothetical protein BDK51DRAFT_33039 [Blyttiomyces helicus]|eukprot:RKO86488.1 hypothetical protein BDK51DRAFT_33039 [Blyttiomyces helicus]